MPDPDPPHHLPPPPLAHPHPPTTPPHPIIHHTHPGTDRRGGPWEIPLSPIGPAPSLPSLMDDSLPPTPASTAPLQPRRTDSQVPLSLTPVPPRSRSHTPSAREKRLEAHLNDPNYPAGGEKGVLGRVERGEGRVRAVEREREMTPAENVRALAMRRMRAGEGVGEAAVRGVGGGGEGVVGSDEEDPSATATTTTATTLKADADIALDTLSLAASLPLGSSIYTADLYSDDEYDDGDSDEEDDSPYAEVRASVSNTDDPSMPCNTFRTWFLGILFTILISGVNQFFSLRYPSITVTALLAQLLALPMGKAMERCLPVRSWRVGRWEGSLNPGPFNIKEHTLISVMANVVSGGAYATEIVAAQRTYYGQNWDMGYQLCLVISTQLLGFSLAGICRRFLVWPSSMIWPQQLVSCAVLNTLHSTWGEVSSPPPPTPTPPPSRPLSRWKFFWLSTLGSFTWYWFPGYLFTSLSAFNYVCWAAPANLVVNQLFGSVTGLGMGVLTLDWSQVAYTSNPLVMPWWAEANVLASLVVWFWVLGPIVYYKNIFYSAYLPMSADLGFDNTAVPYNVSRVLADGTFDAGAYEAYSPVFLPATFALAYAMQFATLTGTIVHTLLWYRQDVVRQFRASLRDEPDIHARLMTAYPEVPSWWYALLGLGSFGLGALTIFHWPTELAIWAYLLSLLIPLVYVIPLGILQAITNQQIGLNVVTELVVGYALPGKPVAMMVFKTFGYITMTQALSFVGDLKFGHYMKIPPRVMFATQTVAAFVACFVVVLVQSWMFANISTLCSADQEDGFTCPAIHVFATASVIFGGVGPARLFSHGATYGPLMWFFLIGAVMPIPFYVLSRRYPTSWFRYVNIPVFFSGTGYLPPATGINYSSWAAVGFVFQYWIRRRHFAWWSRYNYILSAALDAGVVMGAVVIFFVFYLPSNPWVIDWWGNTVWTQTADYAGAPLYTLDEGQTFGPQKGQWR